MSEPDYCRRILSLLPRAPAALPAVAIDDARSRNAGRCMTALVCNRLSLEGDNPKHVRHTTFEWSGGVVVLRNSRVADHHWSTAQDAVVQQLHETAKDRPVAYLLLHWDLENSTLDAWAVPEDIAFESFAKLPVHVRGDSRTVEISPDDHQLKNATDAPSL
jgi:hypothetical protein